MHGAMRNMSCTKDYSKSNCEQMRHNKKNNNKTKYNSIYLTKLL